MTGIQVQDLVWIATDGEPVQGYVLKIDYPYVWIDTVYGDYQILISRVSKA